MHRAVGDCDCYPAGGCCLPLLDFDCRQIHFDSRTPGQVLESVVATIYSDYACRINVCSSL
eukprot:COSAG01_NODE_2790_length_7072_cov_665.915818_6_plen_61_part_00